MAEKRNRKTLELESKIAIINELENGQKQSFICKTRNLTKQTVSKIWANRDKLKTAYAESSLY